MVSSQVLIIFISIADMLVSLTIVRYNKIAIPFAFVSMAIFRLPLLLNRKCSFFKLMGCGRKGTFDLKPDLQQWALLASWDDRDSFNDYLNSSFIASYWKYFAKEVYTILCQPVSSHGSWDGHNPFQVTAKEELTGPVAVLTRATIRLNRLKHFWRNVGAVADIMKKSPGYITSFGIGEAPFFLQATFSLWDSLEEVKSFAYRSAEHAEVIKKTRQENWYSEELFARFKPLATFGTLNGIDTLKNKL